MSRWLARVTSARTCVRPRATRPPSMRSRCHDRQHVSRQSEVRHAAFSRPVLPASGERHARRALLPLGGQVRHGTDPRGLRFEGVPREGQVVRLGTNGGLRLERSAVHEAWGFARYAGISARERSCRPVRGRRRGADLHLRCPPDRAGSEELHPALRRHDQRQGLLEYLSPGASDAFRAATRAGRAGCVREAPLGCLL